MCNPDPPPPRQPPLVCPFQPYGPDIILWFFCRLGGPRHFPVAVTFFFLAAVCPWCFENSFLFFSGVKGLKRGLNPQAAFCFGTFSKVFKFFFFFVAKVNFLVRKEASLNRGNLDSIRFFF